MQGDEIEAATKVETYVREIFKPWSEFYGHQEALAEIIKPALTAAEARGYERGKRELAQGLNLDQSLIVSNPAPHASPPRGPSESKEFVTGFLRCREEAAIMARRSMMGGGDVETVEANIRSLKPIGQE